MSENTQRPDAHHHTLPHQRFRQLAQHWLQSQDLRNTLKTLGGV